MLKRIGSVKLPLHESGGYDHADVHKRSGKVYVAHTANGSVEVVDGEAPEHIGTIPGCAEASGVLCAQEDALVFAAARGEGKVLVVDAETDRTVREVRAGSRPNGLAWDNQRRHLLVADVEDNRSRLLDPDSGAVLGELALRGRPRWCVYERSMDVFLVNLRDPPGVAVISPSPLSERDFIQVPVRGPHGLEIIEGDGKAFVACDGEALVALNLQTGEVVGTAPLSGEPDVLWLNPTKNRLYCAIGTPGVVDVIDTEKLVQTEKLVTERGAHTLTFDAARQRLYALMPMSQCVAVYSE